MTINSLQEQEATAPEKKPMSVQNELQKEVLKQTMGEDAQKQLMQLLATAQPVQQIQETAKNQLSKGYLDIKI